VTENDQNEVLTRVATQFFDVSVNPLAGMICSFLALQVSKGLISKNEAKAVIVSSLDLINQSTHADDILANGHDMLMRMIKTIDSLPDNNAQPSV
jgi:hypothetical protein